jgi:hypothetical protein
MRLVDPSGRYKCGDQHRQGNTFRLVCETKICPAFCPLSPGLPQRPELSLLKDFTGHPRTTIGQQLRVECELLQELPPTLTALLDRRDGERNPYGDVVGTEGRAGFTSRDASGAPICGDARH